MPHSINTAGSNPAYSHDMLALNQNSPYPQVNSASSSRRNSLQSNAWRRQSLPVVDPYSDLMARAESDHLTQRRPGDRTSFNGSITNGVNGMNGYHSNGQKPRKQYYDEQFQQRDAVTGYARERVLRESPIVAELRTNVIVKDEFTLVTDLSYHLAKRYGRQDSAVMVKVDHSACLALGGTFDPCYILTITAVPALMGPTMNKRNAALVQSFMADILSVPPERGLLKFMSIPEENFATNGTTMLGEIERQEKQPRPDMVRSQTSTSRKSLSSMSMKKPNGTLSNGPVPNTAPKLDLDFNLRPLSPEPQSAVDTSAPLGTVDEKKSIEQPATPVTSLHAPTGVFELPTVEAEPKRPSTSHSHTAKAMTGLRVNGSAIDLTAKSDRLPNGRPRTFNGEDFKALHQSQSQAPQLPQLNIVSIPAHRKDRVAAFLKNDQASGLPSAKQHDGKRDSYLDSLMGEPVQLTTIADLKQNTEPFIPIMLDKKESAANGAQRKNSVTATPKMPAPPAVPQDTSSVRSQKSQKSQKVGKRKSFLAAFRRSATVNKH